MKKAIIPIIAALALCACHSEDKEIYSRQIDIKSVPVGATIIVDGFKIGTAPISIGVETNDDGYFVRKTVITAIPDNPKHQTQVITFPAYLASNPEKSEVPEKITFHMDKSPSAGGVMLNEDDDD